MCNSHSFFLRCIRWDLIAPSDASEMDAIQRAFHNATLDAVTVGLNINTSTEEYRLLSPAYQPALSSASNWCRNPASLRDRVFCFTGVDEWEYCSLPSPPTRNQIYASSEPSSMGLSLLGIFISVVFLAVFVAIIVIVGINRKSRRIQTVLLDRLQTAWRWQFARSSSQSCLLGENVSYRAGIITRNGAGDQVV